MKSMVDDGRENGNLEMWFGVQGKGQISQIYRWVFTWGWASGLMAGSAPHLGLSVGTSGRNQFSAPVCGYLIVTDNCVDAGF